MRSEERLARPIAVDRKTSKANCWTVTAGWPSDWALRRTDRVEGHCFMDDGAKHTTPYRERLWRPAISGALTVLGGRWDSSMAHEWSPSATQIRIGNPSPLRRNGMVCPSFSQNGSEQPGGEEMTIPISIIGIDLGKNWFHVVGLDAKGTVLLRKKMNRGQLSEFAATTPRCVVAMESCAGSQHWGRVFAAAGHEVRLLPGQFVKPYVQGNKNDFHDATAIAEAGQRARMRCVPLKTTEQIELQALHRVRQGIVRERTAVVNQMRGLLLEHGIVAPVGRSGFGRRLPTTLLEAERRLSPRLLEVLASPATTVARARRRDRRSDTRTDDLGRAVRGVPTCRDGPRYRAPDRHSHRRGGGQWAHVSERARHGGMVGDRSEPALDRWEAHAGSNQQARECVPACPVCARRPRRLRAPEAGRLGARRVDPERRSSPPPPGGHRRAGQQDGPDLLEGAHHRRGVPSVSGPRRLDNF